MTTAEASVAVQSETAVRLYPIAEQFTSIQGEGLFAGTMMRFVRLAGCSVGKPLQKEERERLALPQYIERCTTFSGKTFLCDTNFRVAERLSVSQILDGVPSEVRHLCLTGGEPLNHDLTDLVTAAMLGGLQVHIETSGTVWWVGLDALARIWVTVSPKWNVLPRMLQRADEVKFLVDKDFDLSAAVKLIEPLPRPAGQIVWLQPINKESLIDFENLQCCVELLHRKPSWRLSIQMHKILGCR